MEGLACTMVDEDVMVLKNVSSNSADKRREKLSTLFSIGRESALGGLGRQLAMASCSPL